MFVCRRLMAGKPSKLVQKLRAQAQAPVQAQAYIQVPVPVPVLELRLVVATPTRAPMASASLLTSPPPQIQYLVAELLSLNHLAPEPLALRPHSGQHHLAGLRRPHLVPMVTLIVMAVAAPPLRPPLPLLHRGHRHRPFQAPLTSPAGLDGIPSLLTSTSPR